MFAAADVEMQSDESLPFLAAVIFRLAPPQMMSVRWLVVFSVVWSSHRSSSELQQHSEDHGKQRGSLWSSRRLMGDCDGEGLQQFHVFEAGS